MGKHCHLFSIALVISIQCYNIVCLSGQLALNRADEEALLALKAHVILDPENILAKNWSSSISFCNWFGVSCGPRHKRVTALSLPGMSLNGTLPPQLGNLSFLTTLDLRDNNFHGNLPPELAKLRRLKSMILLKNYFSGEIPEQIGYLPRLQDLFLSANTLSGSIPLTIFNSSSLKRIVLATNNLEGSVPDDLCDHLPVIQMLEISFNNLSGKFSPNLERCRPLQILGLSNNRFTGTIPREFGNLTMLKELYLGFNNLEGEIPRELSRLVRLERFAVENSGLTGRIPSEMFNISTLKDFVVMNNSVSGSLPHDLCHRLPNLEKVFFFNNKLDGNFPADIGNCTMLQQLRLGRNNFTGVIPREIGNLKHLEILRLAINSLTGPIPPGIFNMSTLKEISLAQNYFSGNLPSDIGTGLPNVDELMVGANKLSGNIPDTIGNASKLAFLEFSENLFTGTIPKSLGNLESLLLLGLANNHFINDPSTPELSFITPLAKCRQLRTLAIAQNPLVGVFPPSIANLSTSLEIFDASGCKIFGKIPGGFRNLSNLFSLSLSNNELTGPISNIFQNWTNLQRLYLSGNMFEGTIPDGLCHLRNLGELFLGDNRFSGPIPRCFDNLTSLRIILLNSNNLSSNIPSTLWNLKNLLVLNLSSNSLSGSLAPEIGNLKVLTQIDLSKNTLAGHIPPNFGDLKDLTSLSLAHNNLQGSIPESFGYMVSMEFLDLSGNNLSGVIPKSLERLSFLKYLNVSFNTLEGEIPNGGPFGNFSARSFIKNHALCGSPRLLVPPCNSSTFRRSRTTTMHVLRYVLPTISLIILVTVLFIVFKRYQNKKTNPPAVTEDSLPLATWRRVSYYELLQATDGFSESNFIGSGSFGTVYRGTLQDEMTVAIKVFNLQLEGAFRSFDVECEVMRTIRHRNVVKIISSCCTMDFKALVLEFMPNGSLEKWLYSPEYFLDIMQRLNIMIEVASALEYLHFGNSTPVIHCDLKPSNVLLDEEMVAHVCDFGIAKLLGEGNSLTQTITLATMGYMAPEYGSTGVVSTRGDVYNYGILVMETFTGRKPTNEMFAGEMNLKSWVKESLPHAITEVADAALLGEKEENFMAKTSCISSVLQLALDCCAESPRERKDTKDVVVTLAKIKEKFLKAIG
ncbi:probable LRR receptor-like serine/threonine-protein kinase At3g47570 [Herrania umbratica]|uniref:non-specific serine/threonine protein kinase n=1 Tax=Herrania umbratica TaxID=108875 RepID=A0A6J1ANS4_9ROSI|nr:probable LRR receptor-like serine/threonine-protein kinase At3g47570 [Herrania umbratica]